ncbi:ornithine cyclodeaminase family protein [Roseicella aerolata]|uniref:Ornithine cyclodeaminase family protein n=1 Tax=Roseicella aerolata TaxID=2883479 RepID=A0A9X1IAK7_9PROT|nr:ornithine cyclodeaminase family protein [Roseicella aerolata]MCB4820877.1 ornithine cyclodeaminase family protein [Roseicella aerolata]
MLPFFDEAQVRAVLRMEDLIPAVEQALIAFSAGRVAQPVRQMLTVEPQGGFFGAMPAAGEVGMGVKLVTFYPGNAGRGLHTHMAMILLFDPETGEPLAVMDGRLITEMRTAAASAVATRALAAPEAGVLAILGTGVQARVHVEALRLVRSFQEVRIWGRTPAKAARLADELGAVAMPLAEDAVRGADVVVTATSSLEPVLQGAWLAPHAHVNAVGWRGPKGRELDEAAMRGAFVVADSREAVLRESGDVLLSGAEVQAELGEILAGRQRVPPGMRTVFESVGMAVEDVAAARLVHDRLRARG